MAKRCLVKAEEKINTGTVYRVMWKDYEFNIHEEKFKDEDEAREFYYSIDRPNRVRELDVIKQCRYMTLKWELL